MLISLQPILKSALYLPLEYGQATNMYFLSRSCMYASIVLSAAVLVASLYLFESVFCIYIGFSTRRGV